MCSTFRSRNVIDKSIRIVTVRIVVLHSHFDRHIIYHTFTVNDLLIKRCRTAVQVSNEFFDSAFVVECSFFRLFLTVVLQYDFQSFCQECHLAESLFQNIKIKDRCLKNGIIRQECYFCTGLSFFTVTDHGQFLLNFSALVTLLVYFTLVVDLNFQPVGKRIYNRRSDTVKSTGYLVSSTTEFTSCMQHGKYNFYRRKSCFVVDTNRNSTSIIDNGHRIVFIDCYINRITEARQSFVYGIIDNLVYKMMQASG